MSPQDGARKIVAARVKSSVNSLFLRDEELRQGIEMLLYAYRDFIAEPDAILRRSGFGRAHHRVIYFVGRYPDTNVSALLEILQVTKQSLNRVLGQLVRENYIQQIKGQQDRRQCLLRLTVKGRDMERQLTVDQRARIARAYRDAGVEAVVGFRKVMLELISRDEDRVRFKRLDDESD